MNLELWEVMVPCKTNEGRPIRTKQHRVWDEKVRKITGGLTIFRPAIGQWVDPESGELFKERMIPVRIAATRDQISEIIDLTMDFYEQLAVMASRVSEEVIIRHVSERKGRTWRHRYA